MKKLVFIFVAFTVQICLFAQEYFPEGTKWTEIRLDTLKYDSWYSKVGEEWMPNFETIEYYVKGNYIDRNKIYKKVYTNGSEWTDSLALLIYDNGYDNKVSATVLVHDFNLDSNGDYVPWPGETYQFDWSVREGLYYCDIMESNSTGAYPYYYYFGMINEIKEGDFGGVRPMRYVDLDGKAPYDPQNPGNTDTNGARIIQGIGVTEWNDGECIFGPVKPYEALSFWGAVEYEERHYRSMLVHFERDGEVLFDVWPEKKAIEEPVTYTTGQMATIILPTEPDASKGKYYRLDRCEKGQIIFEQELQPQARVPYIIVPDEDFSIDLATLDLAGLSSDTVSIGGISFIGSYVCMELPAPTGGEGSSSYIDIIDLTPDCGLLPSEETGQEAFLIGALRAYLIVNWDDPIYYGGTRGKQEKPGIVLKDDGTGIDGIQNSEFKNQNEEGSIIYDLSGRRVNNSKFKVQSSKPQRGIYIEKGRKVVK